MSHSKYRGHNIEFVNDIWIYSDNKIPVSEDKNRACGHCGKSQAKEGHDGCIGTLEGVMNACCGHGKTKEAYVQYPDKSVIRAEEAMNVIKRVRLNSIR